MKTIRIFISSPGDVQAERQIAGKVVERLQGKYWSFVRLEDVFWEEKVIRSTGHYQDELIHPGNCEIVVGVLWSRLGSPLPEKFRLQAGSATTGTEWEIEMAFSAYEERLSQLLAEGLPEAKARQMAKPDIVIYRRSSERERHSNPEQEAEAQDQQQKLEHYLKQHFKNADQDSTIKRPLTGYSTLDEFEAKLTRNLEELILRTIPDLKPGFEPPPISGSPFKGLRAFGFDDSDRFFGRNRQIREIQDLLQKRAERDCPFVLIYGASGYGKSSLMRAGLAPVLTRPGGAGEGKDLWRRVLMQPAVGEGSLTERLVRLLAASPSLEEVVLHKENGTYALSGLSEWQSKFKQAEVSEPQGRWDVSMLTRVLESEELREQGVCLIRICLEEMTTHLLVQVDQLEEVFTTSGMTDPERETFFAVLAALMETGRVWVVATMRSEFFPRIAESPELRRLVGKDGGYILPPPDRQALREIIRYPALAARLGYQRRTGLVTIGGEPARYEDLDDEILADAESSPDALPLLEFCLQELYESILDPQDPKQQRRLSEVLRWQDYAKLGGLKGAIAQRADGVFANLADEVKRAAPMVFASLVRVETGKGTVVRQRSSLETLKQSHAFAGRLLEAMQAAHLLVSDEQAGCAMVTLAHEALLSHWGRLSTWVADHRGDLLARQRLREQAELWESHGRQKSYLLAEARLAEAERVMQVGLFQLEPEEEALIHQSQQRSQKQVWALRVAVAFFAFVALTAVLLGRRAERQKEVAEERRLIAQKAKATAEGLINTMLYDLRDKLEPLGRVELLDDVSRQAEEYFRDNPPESATEKREMSTMWKNRGDVHVATGDLTVARQAYQKSLEIREVLAKLEPRNAQAQRDWGILLDIMGGLAAAAGDLTAAALHNQKALEIFESLAKADPRNVQAQREWSQFLNKLGDQARVEGDLTAAREHYQKSLKILEPFAKGEPSSSDLLSHWIISTEKLGDLAMATGGLASARSYYQMQIKILEPLAKDNPRNAIIQRDWGGALIKLGDMAIAEGDKGAARQNYQNSLEILEPLAKDDSRDVLAQQNWGLSLEKLGNIAMTEGDINAASQYYQKSLIIRESLAKADPLNTLAQSAWGSLLINMGDNALVEGDLDTARQHYRKSLEIFESLAKADPRNAHALSNLGSSCIKLGDIAMAVGDLSSARQNYQKSLEIMEPLAKADLLNALAQHNWGVSLEKLGDLATAEGELSSARQNYQKSLEIMETLTKADPHKVQAQLDWLGLLLKLGEIDLAEGEMAAARQTYKRVLEILEPLDKDDPRNGELRLAWLFALGKSGDVAMEEEDLTTARQAYQKSLEIHKDLAKADPHSAEVQRDLLISLHRIASLLEAEKDGEASKAWRMVLEQMVFMKERDILLPSDAAQFDEIRQKAGINPS